MHRVMWLMSVCLLLCAPVAAWADDVTVTTYYPSPRGVYDELRTSGDVGIGTIGAVSERLQVEGGDLYIVTGDLGIGTQPNFGGGALLLPVTGAIEFVGGGRITSSASTIEIGNNGLNHDLKVWGSEQIRGKLAFDDGAGAFDVEVAHGAAASTLQIGRVGLPNTLLVNTDTLFAGGTKSRVGVGTVTPAVKLEVDGQNEDHVLRVTNDGATPDSEAVMEFARAGNPNAWEIGQQNDGFVIARIWAGNPGDFFMQPDGDVGIGTITPTAQVEIVQENATDALHVQDQAADPTPFVINEGGRVGIKTPTVDPLVDLAIGREDRGFRADPDSLVYHFDGKDMIWFTDSGKVGIGYEPGPGFFADIVVNDAIEVRTASNDDGQAAYYIQNTNVGWFWQIEHMLNGDYAFRNNFGGGVPVRARIDQNGNFYALSKNFDIPHPLDPVAKRLIHASVEGPETAVYYRGEGRLEAGRTSIRLPDYFEALTHPEGRTVQLTSRFSGEEPVSLLAASEVTNGSFDVRAVDDRNPAQAFYWEVKAARQDVAPLQVERPAKPEEAAHAP